MKRWHLVILSLLLIVASGIAAAEGGTQKSLKEGTRHLQEALHERLLMAASAAKSGSSGSKILRARDKISAEFALMEEALDALIEEVPAKCKATHQTKWSPLHSSKKRNFWKWQSASEDESSEAEETTYWKKYNANPRSCRTAKPGPHIAIVEKKLRNLPQVLHHHLHRYKGFHSGKRSAEFLKKGIEQVYLESAALLSKVRALPSTCVVCEDGGTGGGGSGGGGPKNTAPAALAANVSLLEDEQVQIILEGQDADGDALTYTVVESPAHGTLSGQAPTLFYTPQENYNGEDSFTFLVNDGISDSVPATVTLLVSPVNDPPTAVVQVAQVEEDGSVVITLTGDDIDGDPITFRVTEQPQFGVLDESTGELRYTPLKDVNGQDFFSFVVSDGTLESDPAQVEIQIQAVNDAPTAQIDGPQEGKTGQNVLFSGATSSDPEGDELTYKWTLLSPDGSSALLSASEAEVVSFVPDGKGTYTLTLTVLDGELASEPAVFTFTVINSAPIANAGDNITGFVGAVALLNGSNSSDIDGDSLTFLWTLSKAPSDSLATLQNPASITPSLTPDKKGIYEITLQVSDGTITSSPSVIQLLVENRAPQVLPLTVTLLEDTPTEFTVDAADPDGDEISFKVTQSPSKGIISGTGPTFTYTPNQDEAGDDSFQLEVSDGTTTTQITLAVVIEAVNDLPVVTSTPSAEAKEGEPYSYQIKASDVEGQPLRYNLRVAPEGMTVDAAGLVTWTPSFSQAGVVSVAVEISDEEGTTQQSFEISVEETNQAPRAVSAALEINEDTPSELVLEGSDADEDIVTFSLGTAPQNGTLTGNAPNLTYSPNKDFAGEDSFTFTVSDGSLTSNVATVTITVRAVNDAPVANDQVLSLNEGTTKEITLSGSDIENSPLTFQVQTPPQNGVLTGSAPQLLYTPNDGFYGEDSFTFTASDGELVSAPATVALTILKVNSPPQVTSAAVESAVDTTAYSYQVLAADPDGDALSYSLVKAPAGMTIDTETGLIQWQATSVAPVGQQGANQFCGVDTPALPVDERYTDVIVATDTSKSMGRRFDWLTSFFMYLEGYQQLAGLGAGVTPNRYALFRDSVTNNVVTDPGTMVAMPDAAAAVQRIGGAAIPTEDGFLAFNKIYEAGYFRQNAQKNFIWLGDEPIPFSAVEPNRSLMIERALADEINLMLFLNIRMSCTKSDGSVVTAIGMTPEGYGYTWSENDDDFETCQNPQLTPVATDVWQVDQEAQWRPVIEQTKAVVWDLGWIRTRIDGSGLTKTEASTFPELLSMVIARSFSRINGQRIADNLPRAVSSDLVVSSLRLINSTTVEALLLNRGQASINTPVTLTLAGKDSGNELINHTISSLEPGQTSSVTLTLNEAFSESAIIASIGSDETDCVSENNTAEFGHVVVEVQDTSGDKVHQSYLLTTEVLPQPVVITSSVTDTTLVPNNKFTYQVEVNSERGDSFFYELLASPLTMTLDRFTGEMTWLPAVADIRAHDVRIRVTDNDGNSAEQAFTLDVSAGGDYQTPRVRSISTLSPQNALGDTYVGIPNTEGTGNFTYTLLDSNVPVVLDSTTGQFSFEIQDVFDPLLVFMVEDEFGAKDIGVYRFRICSFDIYPKEFLTGRNYRFANLYFFEDKAYQFWWCEYSPLAVPFNVSGTPRGYVQASFTVDTNIDSTIYLDSLTLSPSIEDVGAQQVAITLEHSNGVKISKAIPVTVKQNSAPVFTSTPPLIAYSKHIYQYFYTYFDADGDELSGAKSYEGPLKNGRFLEGQAFYFFPDDSDIGDIPITLAINDASLDVSTQSYTLTVLPNSAPEVVPPAGERVILGRTVTGTIEAADIEGDPLSIQTLSTIPGFSSSGLNWTFTPTEDFQVGVQTLQLEISDPYGESTRTQLQVEVVKNSAPEVLPLSNNRFVATLLNTVPIETQDADGDSVLVVLTEGPEGLSVSGNAISWTPQADQVGVYQVRVRATDGQGGETDAVLSVEVQDKVFTFSPNTFSTTTASQTLFSYQSNLTNTLGESVSYSLVNAPQGMTVTSTGLVSWTPESSDIGVVSPLLRAASQNGEVADLLFTIEVIDGSVLQILSSSLLACRTEKPCSGQVRFTNPTGGAVTVSLDLAPPGLSVNQEGLLTWTPSEDQIGNYSYTVRIVDSANKEVTRNFPVEVSDSRPETVALFISPLSAAIDPESELEEVTKPTDVQVAASTEVTVNVKVVEIATGNIISNTTAETNSSFSTVTTIDPTLLQNGMYRLTVTAETSSGEITGVEKEFLVDGNMKIGVFRRSFVDMEIPMAGIPLQVVRTYDSRVKYQQDFGVGWSMELRSGKLTHNRPTGENWEIIGTGGLLDIPCSIVNEISRHNTEVRFSDELWFSFRPKLENPAIIAGGCSAELTFEQVDGYMDGASLEIIGDKVVTWQNGTFNLLDSDTFEPFRVDAVRLILPDGRKAELSTTEGLTSYQDSNGNTLTFGFDGVTHSSGKTLQFIRDDLDRITDIVDPGGAKVSYSYDEVTGDLLSVTNQVDETVLMTYDDNHFLESIIDARGITVLSLVFEDGRLVATLDADGNIESLDHQITNFTEVRTNRRGFTTTYEYDERGNIIRETNALGETTQRGYDAEDNEILFIDALGNTTVREYDEFRNILSETDPLGRKTSYTYAGPEQPLTITDPAGFTTKMEYDDNRNVIRLEDPAGKAKTFEYDARGLLTKMTDELGNQMLSSYNSFGQMTEETDFSGVVRTFSYDSRGNQLSTSFTRTSESGPATVRTLTTYDDLSRERTFTDAENIVTSMTYNAIGKKATEVDGRGHTTRYEYDARGNLVKTIYPDNTIVLMTFDEEGNKVSETDELGRVTRFEYDALNRLVKTTYPDGTTTSQTFDKAGRTITSTDQRGNVTRMEYNEAGELTKTIDALGNETVSTYDLRGNLITVTDARGHSTHSVYDNRGRLTQTYREVTLYRSTTSTKNPNGQLWKIGEAYTYDDRGQMTAKTVARFYSNGTPHSTAKTTQYAYDSLSRLIRVTDANGGITSYQYDEAGNKVAQIDALGRRTAFVFDNKGREVARVLPLGQRESNQYDGNDNLSSHTDFNGNTTSYTYDVRNRLLKRQFQDGSSYDFTYFDNGLKESETSYRGVTLYMYDSLNRLSRQNNPEGTYLTYTYDEAGNRTSVGTPNGSTTYTFDSLNRMKTVIGQAGTTTTYEYDEVGNVVTQLQPNGAIETRRYDEQNRVLRITHQTSSGQFLRFFDYEMDEWGNRTRIDDDQGYTLYFYDALDRLTQEQQYYDSFERKTYTYDLVSNIIGRGTSFPAVTYTFDNNDRLVAEIVDDPSVAGDEEQIQYIYDDNGSLVRKSSSRNSVTTYSYDFDDRLRYAETPQEIVEYEYNSVGIRQSRSINGEHTLYVVDENRTYGKVLEELTDPGVINTTYVYGLDLISQTLGADQYWVFLRDGQGSTRALLDPFGDVSVTLDYESFGGAKVSLSPVTDYLFAGEQFDKHLGLYYNRARYYNPIIGRFSQRDKWRGVMSQPVTLNKYIYGNSNPVRFSDPTGMFSMDEVNAAVAGVSHITRILANSRAVHTSREILRFAGSRITGPAATVGAGIVVKLYLKVPSLLRWTRQERVKKVLDRAGWYDSGMRASSAARGGWSRAIGKGPDIRIQWTAAGGRHGGANWKITGSKINGKVRVKYYFDEFK